MPKLPTVFSLRHFLVLSLALNVSLILRMVYEGDEVYNRSCSKKETGISVAGADESNSQGHKSRLVISSTSSSLANSTCTDREGGTNRVINLDQ